MDATALQLEQIKVGLDGTYRLAEFHARWRTGLLVVAATLAGSVTVAYIAGQWPAQLAGPLVALLAGFSGWQVFGLRQLASRMSRAEEEAKRAIGRLMLREGEDKDDGQEADAV